MGRDSNIANLRWLVTVEAGGSLKTLQGVEAAVKEVGQHAHGSFERLNDELSHVDAKINSVFNSLKRGNFGENVGKQIKYITDALNDPKFSGRQILNAHGEDRLETARIILGKLQSSYVAKLPSPTIDASPGIADDPQAIADAIKRNQLQSITEAAHAEEDEAKARKQSAENKRARILGHADRYEQQEDNVVNQRRASLLEEARNERADASANAAIKAKQMADITARAQAEQDTSDQRRIGGEELRRRAINHARRYWQEEQDFANSTFNSDRAQRGLAIRVSAEEHADRNDRRERANNLDTFLGIQPGQRTNSILAQARNQDNDPFTRKLNAMGNNEVEKIRSKFQKMAGSSDRYADQLDTLNRRLSADHLEKMGKGSDTRQFRWQAMNFGYGIEDASVGYQLNGIKGAIRGSLNNITAMAQGLKNPYMAGSAVVGATAIGMAIPPLIDYITKLSRGRNAGGMSSDLTSNYDEFDRAEESKQADRNAAGYSVIELNRSMLRGSSGGNYRSIRGAQDKNADMLEAAEAKAEAAARLRDASKAEVTRTRRDKNFGYGGVVGEGVDDWISRGDDAIKNFFDNSRAVARSAHNSAKIAAEQATKEWGAASNQAIEAKRRVVKLEERAAILKPTRDMEQRFQSDLAEFEETSSPEEQRKRLEKYQADASQAIMAGKGTAGEKKSIIAKMIRETNQSFEDDYLSGMNERGRMREKSRIARFTQMENQLRHHDDPTYDIEERHRQKGQEIASQFTSADSDRENRLHKLNDYERQIALDKINRNEFKSVNEGLTSGSRADAALRQQLGANLQGSGGEGVGIDLLSSNQRVEQHLAELVAFQRDAIRNRKGFRR